MLIYNVKINKKVIFKTILVIMIIICISIGVSVLYHILHNTNKNNNTFINDSIPSSEIAKLTPENYTNILKTVHENIDDYVGIKINFTGYVYRVLDLTDNQFVLARDMIISSNYQSVVVGFLCEYEKANEFKDNTWVEVTGEIYKGKYHGDMPIVKVTKINEANKPNDEYVYPPDESYIPTSGIV